MLLELHHISKSYTGPRGTVQALADVSLAVNAGEFVAIQGPSGCGKSTLLFIAGGLLRPDGGAVRIGGCDPYGLSPDARAVFRGEHIGFVFQQFHLVPYLSVLDNVLAATLALGNGHVVGGGGSRGAAQFPEVAARERAIELIDRLGLSQRMHHVPASLSSGERQRTALARALMNRPRLVLADEPTGNLDRENAAAVLEFLAGFAREGVGVLLVTHEVAAAEQAARVIRLRDGRVDAARERASPAIC